MRHRELFQLCKYRKTDRLIVEWRVKSQALYLTSRDANWTNFGRIGPDLDVIDLLARLEQAFPQMEFRLKPVDKRRSK